MYSGTHTFNVNRTDGTVITLVTLMIDGVLFDVQTGDRATGQWAFAVDTTKLSGTVASPQNHTLTARMWDGYGQSTLTSSLVITVAN